MLHMQRTWSLQRAITRLRDDWSHRIYLTKYSPVLSFLSRSMIPSSLACTTTPICLQGLFLGLFLKFVLQVPLLRVGRSHHPSLPRLRSPQTAHHRWPVRDTLSRLVTPAL